MAIQNAPQDNYPFSTRDGKVIPLDILRSKYYLYQDFTAGASAPITLPVGTTVVAMYADEDCVIVPESTADIVFAANTPLTKAIMLPRKHVVIAAIPEGAARVRGLTLAGRIHIQVIEQWVGLGLDIQYKRG